jgi:aryl-alcohol dehydrogenase-like predicted oxidoreductase
MHFRPLGKTGLLTSAIGYGALKIGRNEAIKYPQAFDLPDEAAADRLLNACLDLGINYMDTARAYGLSEERIGNAIGHRRREYVLSSKAGEIFENGQSRYDYTPAALRASVEKSLSLLRTDVLDVLFVHTKDDVHLQNETDAVPTFQAMKAAGLVRFIGLSAKTPTGAELALSWADALMVEYNSEDRAIEPVIAKALEHGIGIVVKKGLGSGRLAAEQAIEFVLGNLGVSSLIVGSLNLEHLKNNLRVAESCVQ